MTDGKLKSLFERINKLLDEKAALTADIADVFQEVKSAGYIPKVLRTVIRRARADQSKLAEEDAIQELYEGALTGRQRKAVELAASGATAREIEQETGLRRSDVSRSVPLKKSRGTKQTAHDPATGEVLQHATPQPPEPTTDSKEIDDVDDSSRGSTEGLQPERLAGGGGNQGHGGGADLGNGADSGAEPQRGSGSVSGDHPSGDGGDVVREGGDEGIVDHPHDRSDGLSFAEQEAAMLEAGARWNSSVRRVRGEAA